MLNLSFCLSEFILELQTTKRLMSNTNGFTATRDQKIMWRILQKRPLMSNTNRFSAQTTKRLMSNTNGFTATRDQKIMWRILPKRPLMSNTNGFCATQAQKRMWRFCRNVQQVRERETGTVVVRMPIRCICTSAGSLLPRSFPFLLHRKRPG